MAEAYFSSSMAFFSRLNTSLHATNTSLSAYAMKCNATSSAYTGSASLITVSVPPGHAFVSCDLYSSSVDELASARLMWMAGSK